MCLLLTCLSCSAFKITDKIVHDPFHKHTIYTYSTKKNNKSKKENHHEATYSTTLCIKQEFLKLGYSMENEQCKKGVSENKYSMMATARCYGAA